MNELFLPQGGSIQINGSHEGNRFLSTATENVTRMRGDGIDADDLTTINDLLSIWREKYPRNLIRSRYYDARENLKDFGISIPNSIKNKVGAVIGWPEKAVRSLADKSTFEGFAVPDGNDNHGIARMMADNELDVDVSEAIISAYKHSCSFITVARDPDSPEDSPRMIFMPCSADWSSAKWDRRHRRISGALTIIDDDAEGRITEFNAWLPGKTYHCTKNWGVWYAERFDTNLDRPSVVPLVYDKQMDRPFGRSRINRTLINLTDTAFRTIIRMEASAEFYSVPKLWFLGADPDAFSEDTWSSLVSAINAIGRDQDGTAPDLKQISQASMTPHGDMLETIAMLVSSQTDIPAENLGIRVTNPTSAEALAAAENSLTRTANRQNRFFGRQLINALTMAIQMQEGLRTAPDDLLNVRPIWTPTKESSDASKADYYTKIASVNASFADSDVGLMKAGLNFDEIKALRKAQRQQRSQGRIEQLKTQNANQPSTENGSDADDLQSKFTALGIAIRAGVAPDAAAAKLGLQGIKFTGMTPVSLRPTEGTDDGSERPASDSGQTQGAAAATGQGA
jgi:hypothetical protein